MKQTLIFLAFAIPLFCMAQNLVREYEYDAVGNRTLRKTITMNLAPPAPQDTVTSDGVTSDELFYVEKIAQTEIKIYPNPTTEKITLEISGWETLQRGNLKLYSLTGQLLQEHSVHSIITSISLENLPKGVYILKVNINDKTEDWKVIKN